MPYEEKVTKKSDNEEYIQALTEVSGVIAGCSGDVQNSAQAIILSCNALGTKGEKYKDILLTKADDMEKLAALFKTASNRLLNAAKDLEEGKLTNDVLSKVLTYGLFLVDQLKCEEEDASNVLQMLRGRRTK